MKQPPKPQRPTALIVLAIFNILIGGVGLLSILGMALYALFLYLLWRNLPPDPNGMEEMLGLYRALFSAFGLPLLIAGVLLTILISTLLIVGGIGLLRLRPWARWLCLGYGVCEFTRVIGFTIYTIMVVNPALMQALAEFNEKLSRKTKGPPMPMIFSENMFDIMAIAAAVFWMIFPTALLIVLSLPRVRAAFTQGGVREDGIPKP
jgi:membrane protein insertase Oxa1/YidC/SpoIIIJ